MAQGLGTPGINASKRKGCDLKISKAVFQLNLLKFFSHRHIHGHPHTRMQTVQLFFFTYYLNTQIYKSLVRCYLGEDNPYTHPKYYNTYFFLLTLIT